MNHVIDEIGAQEISVFKLEDCRIDQWHMLQSNISDYYIITLCRNFGGVYFVNKTMINSATALLFLSPKKSCSIEFISNGQTGFICTFSKSFFTDLINTRLNALPPIVKINEPMDLEISGIFTSMLFEIDSNYAYKFDLLRNYIAALVHIVLKSLSRQG